MTGLLAVHRRLSVIATLAIVASALWTSPLMAAAAGRAPVKNSPAAHSVGASQMTLAQAPTGLQAAARSVLGFSSGSLEQAKLTASDGAFYSYFGNSVAISGSTAVVGAFGPNSATGAAYVFVRSGTAWTQQAKLTASDGRSDDYFGSSVAISGSTAVVGSPFHNSHYGAAYVFERLGTTWSEQAKLTASGGTINEEFGCAVTISGSNAVVGAPYSSSTGAAYVFGRSGSTWSQQSRLTASDGAAGDLFGCRLAISGSTAVVGAYRKDSYTGAAYVFVGSGTTWSQQAKLTASDGVPLDDFGYSVGISGSDVVVGAQWGNSGTGAVYMYTRSGTAWTQRPKLTASDGVYGDQFGSSVAISGNHVVVGANGRDSSKGAGYVFVRSGTAWPQQAKLTASDRTCCDQFGTSVSISGSSALVGAPRDKKSTGAAYAYVLPYQRAIITATNVAPNDYFGYSVAIFGSAAVVGSPYKNLNTGAAYVFVRSGTTWSQQATLAAADGAADDRFGFSVAISGSTVVVGSPYKDSNTGTAYVFVGSGATWTEQAKLIASDGAAIDRFGSAVAISDSTVVVGSPNKNSYTGAAYVFVRSGTTWSQQMELTASDGAASDIFGFSVAISGSTALVGAVNNSGAGAAYVFVRSGTTWSQQAKLTATDRVAGDWFGYSVAVAGSRAVVGSPNKNSFTGSAYVFARSGTSWSQLAKLSASDGASNDRFGWSVAISGSTAVVGAPIMNSHRGAAYVFWGSVRTWTEQARLAPIGGRVSDFGWSVATSGRNALVGAPYRNIGTGAAYVFVLP